MPGARLLGRVWILRLFLCVIVAGLGYVGLRVGGLWAKTSPDVIWKQAEAELQVGRYDRVNAALERLGRLREPTPLDWFLRGQLALARDEVDRAIDLLSRVPDDHYTAPARGSSPVRPS